MKIEVLGTGCAKCKTLEKVAQEAVAQLGVFAQVEKVEDIAKIMDYGVMSTPALVVDGVVKLSGRVPSQEELVALLKPTKGCGCVGAC
jgi:small redox-active disulfide protein 2